MLAAVYVNAWWLLAPSLTWAVLVYALDQGRKERSQSGNNRELGRLLAEALAIAFLFIFIAHYVVG